MKTFTATTTVRDWTLATADELADPVAHVILEVIRDAIRAVPGNRWDKSGKLLAGLRVERVGPGQYAVMPPEGRLESDALMERLVADVPLLLDPTQHPRVQAAIVDALARAVRA